jgi:hypothetical protein
MKSNYDPPGSPAWRTPAWALPRRGRHRRRRRRRSPPVRAPCRPWPRSLPCTSWPRPRPLPSPSSRSGPAPSPPPLRPRAPRPPGSRPRVPWTGGAGRGARTGAAAWRRQRARMRWSCSLPHAPCTRPGCCGADCWWRSRGARRGALLWTGGLYRRPLYGCASKRTCQ